MELFFDALSSYGIDGRTDVDRKGQKTNLSSHKDFDDRRPVLRVLDISSDEATFGKANNYRGILRAIPRHQDRVPIMNLLHIRGPSLQTIDTTWRTAYRG